MNIINSEILQSLSNDKTQLQLKIFDLVKEFESKYEGSDITLIMPDNNYSNGKWVKNGMTAKVEVKVDGQKLEIK